MQQMHAVLRQARRYLNAAGRKTGKAVEISKLRIKGVQLNTMIQSTYERIGALVYEEKKHLANNADNISDCITEVDRLLEELNIINKRISDFQNGVTCTQCGTVNQAEYTYCSKCGGTIGEINKSADGEAQLF